MTIHPKFAQWYAPLQAQPGGERLAARSAAIEAFIETCQNDDMVPLLVLAYGLRQKDQEEGIAAFRQVFIDADPGFPDDNSQEMQILAASTLASILAIDIDQSAYAAVAVTTTGLGGARKPEIPMDLGEMAEATISRISERRSTRPVLSEIAPQPAPKWDPAPYMTKIANGEEDGLPSLLNAFQLVIRKDINNQREYQARVLKTIQEFVTVQDDELQVLWWLVGSRSELVDAAFADIPQADLPVVLAVEFARLARELPGPGAARAVLSKAGISDLDKVAIAGLVEGAKKSLGLADQGKPSKVIHPLHFAIERMGEVKDDPTWFKGWASLCDIAEDAGLSALDFAELFYREELLLIHQGN